MQTQNSSDQAHEAQVANLEFLLLNHPLDCPICDRGGECPLQDQALAFGPGESRYEEAKRVYEKPLSLSPLVALDRERCVLCARCTRFCDQVSGDRFIELFERGAAEQVAIAPGEDFRSPFSGNTIQICPVGALTSDAYRFAARPFDLRRGATACATTALPAATSGWTSGAGRSCGTSPATTRRQRPVDVRQGTVRVPVPRLDRQADDAAAPRPGTEPVSFGEACGRGAGRDSRAGGVPGRRAADRRGRVRAVEARARRGSPPTTSTTAGTARTTSRSRSRRTKRLRCRVTYADVERAKVILVVGLDAEQEVPILHLRIRKAAAAARRSRHPPPPDPAVRRGRAPAGGPRRGGRLPGIGRPRR